MFQAHSRDTHGVDHATQILNRLTLDYTKLYRESLSLRFVSERLIYFS
jgi:hypothetical protein